MTLSSKSDRDRLRQRAGGNKKIAEAARRILREYRKGRAASACMAELERVVGAGGKRQPAIESLRAQIGGQNDREHG